MANFLYLPDWTVTHVEHNVSYIANRKSYVAAASYDVDIDTCPKCGVVGQLGKHGSKVSEFSDAPVHGKPCIIRVERRRYRCKACGETSLQPLPDMDERRRMTLRCVEYIGNQALRRPFVQIADDVGIDEKTVRLIAGERIAELDKVRLEKAPRQLGIDEVTVLRNPRAIFTDIENRRVLDLLETRTKQAVARWLHLIPQKEFIQVVTIDMWQPYRDAVRAVLPWADVVVDKFHVVRMASQGLDQIRKKAGHDLPVKNRRKLMRSRYLLLRRAGDLNEMQRMDLDGWLKNVPALHAAYLAKEQFYNIWDSPDKAAAKAALHHWVKTLPPELTGAFKPLLTALGNWEPEILAYWDHRITNAYTEAANGVLKVINRAGRGYSFGVMRARILTMQGEPAKSFVCDECKGKYPVHIKSRSRRYKGNLCANCHRIHTGDWFKRHGTST